MRRQELHLRPINRNLDQFVLDIEFLLISVIQGVALAELAVMAAPILANLQWNYIPYVAGGFFFILIFWSGAIIHAVSFIDWPLDLTHNFLYFLASLFEVMAFANMKDPLRWFGFVAVFFIIAELLYIADLILIKRRQKRFLKTPSFKMLYEHIYKEQKFELSILVPLGILFNLGCIYLIMQFPAFFLIQQGHTWLAVIQAAFAIIFLLNATHAFKKRSALIQQSQN
ncbi:MAG: hypothetical protein HYT10_00350 [Candidatus Levybacteria bacterium]|nr:hypothetical protein [Candidatus Levybacteria bacterium]